jgi:hypothetical protein
VPKTSLLSNVAALLLTAGFAWAAVRSQNSPVDPDRPPEAEFEAGLVRVWNEKGEPPLERDHTPEGQLGDALVVELKNLDQWFAENLEAGAWQDDVTVKNADPMVKELIKDHQLTAAIQVGEQLERLARANSALDRRKETPAAAEVKMAALTSSPELMEQVGFVVWGDYHPKDENGVALDVSNPTQLLRAIEHCTKALQFVRDFGDQQTPKFVLAINDVPLPGLVVEMPEREAGWRLEEDVHDLELKRPTYSWYQFRLQGPHNSEFGKAWARLMQAAGTRFSNPSKVALSLTGEKKPLPSNVTPGAEDSRCRFNLLAIVSPTPTPGQRHFKKGDAVYPLDENDLENHVLKGRIVEEPDPHSDTPYLVHFEERGGTRRYAGTELARLPPDLVPSGVVRVWNGNEHGITEWEDAQKDEIPEARIGETLVVEVRNFGGWLARQIDNGFLQDEALILKAAQSSKSLDDLIKAKRFAATVRVGKKIRQILEYAAHTTATEIVEKLDRDKKNNPDLAALNFPKLTTKASEKLAPPETPPDPVNAQTTPPATKKTPGPETAGVKKDSLRNKEVAAQKEALRIKEEQEAQSFLAPFQAADSLVLELKAAKLRTLILTINDIPLGITPDNSDYAPVPKSRRPAGDPKDDIYYWLHFSLKAKSVGVSEEGKKGEDPFKRLMEHPTFTMPSKVSLTFKTGGDTLILPTAVTRNAEDVRSRFNLIGIEKFKFWPMVFVFILILGSLGFFAASTDILRDPCRRRPEGVEPVSLARTQMAFWFVVIAAAFAFLWVTTGNVDTINGTCLTLLAIGTTTALTTMAVQGNRSGRKDLSDVLQKTPHEMLKLRPVEVREAIAARKKELEETGASTMAPEELAEDTAILKIFERKLDQFFKQRPKWCPLWIYYWRYRLRTVFEDLLTEEAGAYDFHRFQMLAWTLVLGSVFVFKVFSDRNMPQFDSNLLLLMGISSGAYIGFKVAAPRKTDDGVLPTGDHKDETQRKA